MTDIVTGTTTSIFNMWLPTRTKTRKNYYYDKNSNSNSSTHRACNKWWIYLLLWVIYTLDVGWGAEYWRRLAPLPVDTVIGSTCKSSLQCLLFVPHSHCEWESRTCTCQPYHVQVNNTHCFPASLLGFGCSIDAQCTLKVPNSACVDGTCQCHDGFVSYRRDKCLPPAKIDGYCLNDQQCILGGRYSYCKYIIPRIYGKCKCPLGYVLKKGQCLPPLSKRCESDADCEHATPNSFCKLPSFKSRDKDRDRDSHPICACRPGYRPNGNKTTCESIPTPVLSPIVVSSQPNVNTTSNGDVRIVSLGKSCNSDLECQVRDPWSVCRDGICDCQTPTPKCSAMNTGCHNDTFQCRSGQCISWYFVCDKNKNCDDGSDEEDCTTNGCPKEAFTCDDGTCLSRASVCNGRWECPDGSDEARCYKGVACDAKSFRCKSGQCLPQYTFCNAVTDCIDGSDEIDSICEHSQVCPKGTFQCANNKCRSTAILCSGVDGCGDNSDEDRCEVCFCEKNMHHSRLRFSAALPLSSASLSRDKKDNHRRHRILYHHDE